MLGTSKMDGPHCETQITSYWISLWLLKLLVWQSGRTEQCSPKVLLTMVKSEWDQRVGNCAFILMELAICFLKYFFNVII